MMKYLKLCFVKKLFADLILFFLFSIGITYLSNKIPDRVYYFKNWLFRERKWEKGGIIYQRLLKVRQWKRFLPELNDFVKSVFAKKHLAEFSGNYLQKYLLESCKSELTHWFIILSSFVFYLWNDFAFLITGIATVLNLPYIIIQRYNRPRIVKALNNMNNHLSKLQINAAENIGLLGR